MLTLRPRPAATANLPAGQGGVRRGCRVTWMVAMDYQPFHGLSCVRIGDKVPWIMTKILGMIATFPAHVEASDARQPAPRASDTGRPRRSAGCRPFSRGASRIGLHPARPVRARLPAQAEACAGHGSGGAPHCIEPGHFLSSSRGDFAANRGASARPEPPPRRFCHHPGHATAGNPPVACRPDKRNYQAYTGADWFTTPLLGAALIE